MTRLAAAGLSIAVVAWTAFPHLSRGICYEDPGDFQVAAATLGIPHPPGYAGYVSAGHLLTRLSPLDPAFTLNIACLLAGLLFIWMCVRLQMRMGAWPISAATATLLLFRHPELWPQIIVPEVYLPSLLLLTGAILCFSEGKHEVVPQRDRVLLGALLLGALAANRPPALLFVPVFIGVQWLGARRGVRPGGRHATGFGLAAIAFLLPHAYSVGYFYLRDVPANEYNYIEGTARSEPATLPAVDAGVGAKLSRIGWLMSARPYHDRITGRPLEILGNWRAATERLAASSLLILCVLLLLAFAGFRIALQRHPRGAWLLAGCAGGSFCYAGCYRDPGFPADLLPILLALAVFTGIALTRWCEAARWRYHGILAFALAAISGYGIVAQARQRSFHAYDADATRYVAQIRLDKLPPGAVIISSWRTSPPLAYAQLVLCDRRDLEILNREPQDWMREALLRTGAAHSQAVYFAYEPPAPGEASVAEEWGLYRLLSSEAP